MFDEKFEQAVDEAMERIDAAMQDTAADQGDDAAEAAWHDLVRGVADDCPPRVRDEVLRRNFGAMPGDDWYSDPLTAAYGAAGMVAAAANEAALAAEHGPRPAWMTCPDCEEVEGDIALCAQHRAGLVDEPPMHGSLWMR